jgi:hypothetical protein
MHGEEGECIKGFGRKARRKETSKKSVIWAGG